ncbi:MAG TPA: acetyl-CoA carboxylase biotin carboxyl carrier protein [Clostridia bacterium]|jgi:acetyl-CoA carboxylase biotin carboxyl carrier protein|nr:acetyl-CoA carboxylase biotin carboxyl carrier protein [Clostridiaceae bacterium]HPZ51820.1 acetyl-CoA carboxylase biotin carboxyl carrier protein [Clostridia bacterium]
MMNINDIKCLAEVMKKNGLSKLEFEDGQIKLHLERNVEYEVVKSSVEVKSEETFEEEESISVDQNISEVKAPLVGVFYAAKAPGEPPYVEVGDKVGKGDTLCLIEAMKIMNEIPSDVDGTIEEICVTNGQIVEFGQVLFRIRKN